MDDLWFPTAMPGRLGDLVDVLVKRVAPSTLLLAVDSNDDVDLVVFNPDGAAPLSLPDELLAGPRVGYR